MSSLVDSLKNSHFIYDFGNGVSKPVHYVNLDSSGRWNLALPYCREETGKKAVISVFISASLI